jgi:hypothetical protein
MTRDEALVKALWSLSAPIAGASGTTIRGDYIGADTIASHAHHNYGVKVSAIGAGRILSRLAREQGHGVRFNGYMNTYKHKDWL